MQLYGLDRRATGVLMRLHRGEPPQDVLQGLELREDSSGLVYGLATLLAGEESCGEAYRTELPCSRQVPGHREDLPRYRLLGTSFAIDGPEGLVCQWILPYVAHLGTDVESPLDLLVCVEPQGDAWQLRLNGTIQGRPLPCQRLVPVLYGRLRQFAYQSGPYLLTVHGAVVSGKGRTIILAGQSGSGKSTLTAALLARGYGLLSDEPAVIDPSGREILSIPLGLGLKAGSWSAVLADYPGLESLPIHLRFDDQPMRYLLPATIHLVSSGVGMVTTHLVFPCYHPDALPSLEPLSLLQALCALTGSGYQVPELDVERVEGILQWLRGLTCCALTYSSTPEALALLEKAWGTPFPT
jgi:hypothetical protein